jgi:hypothetical protein
MLGRCILLIIDIWSSPLISGSHCIAVDLGAELIIEPDGDSASVLKYSVDTFWSYVKAVGMIPLEADPEKVCRGGLLRVYQAERTLTKKYPSSQWTAIDGNFPFCCNDSH